MEKPQYTSCQVLSDDILVAKYCSASLLLFIADFYIPFFSVGIKPGFANIVTLYVALVHGISMAAWVVVLRILATSILFGHFFSPAFLMSASGALASMLVLFFFLKYLPSHFFGPVTYSVASAFAHILAQLLVARYFLISHAGVIEVLLPIFFTSSFVFGIMNGMIVASLLSRGSKKNA